MHLMRIALLQQNFTVGALAANWDSILAATRQARDQGANLAISSELALLGYPPRDLLERPAFVRAVLAENQRLVSEMPAGITLVFGTIDERASGDGRPLYNAVL